MFSAIIIFAFLYLNDAIIRNPTEDIPVGIGVTDEVIATALKTNSYHQQQYSEKYETFATFEQASAPQSQTLTQKQVANDKIQEQHTANQAKSVLIKDKVKKLMESMEQEASSCVEVLRLDDLSSVCSYCSIESKTKSDELIANVNERIRALEEKVNSMIVWEKKSLIQIGIRHNISKTNK